MAATRPDAPSAEEIDQILVRALGLETQYVIDAKGSWYRFPGDPTWTAPLPSLYAEPTWAGAQLLLRHYREHQNPDDRRFDRRLNLLTGRHPSQITPTLIADAAWFCESFYLGIDFVAHPAMVAALGHVLTALEDA